MTRSLDCYCKSSLMLCTVACDSSWKNLSSLRNISFQLIGILIINHAVLLTAENTYFFSSANAASSHFGAFGFIRFIECHWYFLLYKISGAAALWAFPVLSGGPIPGISRLVKRKALVFNSVRNIHKSIADCAGRRRAFSRAVSAVCVPGAG